MRVLRIIAWLIAFIALSAMSVVVALYFLISADNVERKISSALAPYGLSIQTNERPQIRILPKISVTLPSANILDANHQNFLNYRQAYLEINPFWLILGKVYIDEFHLDGLVLGKLDINSPDRYLKNYLTNKTSLFPDITIAKLLLRDTRLNLQYREHNIEVNNLRAEIAEPSPQMHGVVSLVAQTKVQPSDLLLDLQSVFILDLDLSTGRIGLENLTFNIQGTDMGLPLELSFSAPLLKFSGDSLYASSAKLQWDRNPLKSQLTVAELNIDPNTWQAPDLHVDISMGTPSGTVRLDIRSPFNFDSSGNVFVANHLQGFVSFPGMSESSSLSGSISTDLKQKLAHLEIYGRLHEAPTSFSGDVDLQNHPLIRGNLIFGRLDLEDLALLNVFKSTTANEKEIAVQLSDKSETDTELNTTLKTEQNSSNEHLTNLEISDSGITSLSQENSASNESLNVISSSAPLSKELPEAPQPDFHFLNNFDFNGQVVIGELLAGRLKLIQVKSPLVIHQGTMLLSPISALAYEGRFTGEMNLSENGLWETSFKASGVNLQQLLADAGATYESTGILNAQANLYGKGFSMEQLNGQVGLAISNLQLRGVNLEQALTNIEQGEMVIQDANQITISQQIKTIATLSQLELHTEKLHVTLPEVSLSGEATVDLHSNQLIGHLSGQTRRGLNVRVDLKKSWFEPTLSLNEDEIRNMNQIPTTKQKSEKSSNWDKLKQFFSERF